MLDGTMATAKGAKAAGAKPRAGAKAPEPEGRKKSKLTQMGDDAKREAMRKGLLAELKRQDWNLSRTADALDMVNASNVIRAIHDLDLDAEYEKAKDAGKVQPGRPT